MGFARAYLYFVGAMGLLFGVWYLVAPVAWTDPTGFGPLGPNALTDVRATYGGFQIGLGLFTIWAAADPERVRIGLVLQALTIGAIASCRLAGFAIDGSPNGFLRSAIATEIPFTALALIALRRLPREAIAR
jgi:Domain of unknown function (DUF4345)